MGAVRTEGRGREDVANSQLGAEQLSENEHTSGGVANGDSWAGGHYSIELTFYEDFGTDKFPS